MHFNARHNFTLQYPVLLAPLAVDDDEANALRKLRVVAAWLDILIHRRIWNWRAIDYSTMQYAMFLVMRDIRERTAQELAGMLRHRLSTSLPPPWFAATFLRKLSLSMSGKGADSAHRTNRCCSCWRSGAFSMRESVSCPARR